MDDCPICFATSHLSPLNFAPTGVRWSYSDPDLNVWVDFPYPMDQSVAPVAGDFVLLIDGVPKVPDTAAWQTSTVFELEYAEALLAPTAATLRLPTAVANFRSLELFLVQPFYFVGVEIP